MGDSLPLGPSVAPDGQRPGDAPGGRWQRGLRDAVERNSVREIVWEEGKEEKEKRVSPPCFHL